MHETSLMFTIRQQQKCERETIFTISEHEGLLKKGLDYIRYIYIYITKVCKNLACKTYSLLEKCI